MAKEKIASCRSDTARLLAQPASFFRQKENRLTAKASSAYEKLYPKYAYVLITGRIPDDDEDSMGIYTDVRVPHAIELFKRQIYRVSDRTDRAATSKNHGDDVYINCIVKSDSAFKVESDNLMPRMHPQR